MKIGQPFTSGRWVVKEGNEKEFIARWTEFTEWSLANASGAQSFVLIRENAEPRRFQSFGAWDDADVVNAWRARPEFQARLAACRELCDDFVPTDHTLAASVGI